MARGRSCRAKPAEELTVNSETLHTVVAVVHHEERIAGVERQPARSVELTVARTAVSPAVNELAIGGLYGDAVEVFVADEEPLLSVDGNRRRPDELARALSPRTERADVLVIGVHDCYVDPPRVLAPAHDVQPTVLAERARPWIVEAAYSEGCDA